MTSLVCRGESLLIGSGSSLLTWPTSDLSEEVQQLNLGDYQDRILCFAIAPSGALLATCDDKKRLHIWNVDGQKCSLGEKMQQIRFGIFCLLIRIFSRL